MGTDFRSHWQEEYPDCARNRPNFESQAEPYQQGTYIMFTLWNSVACAAQNMASLIVFRFLAGLFGSSPLTSKLTAEAGELYTLTMCRRCWRHYLRQYGSLRVPACKG
jgi:hypothetical protein